MSSRDEADILAGKIGADSRRIDGLVDGMGQVRGEVTHLRGDVSTLIKGVDNLQQAMASVARHTVLLEATRADMDEVRRHQQATDDRLSVVENEMPGLIEVRTYTMRAVAGVAAAVGLAVLALVIKTQGGA